MATYLTFDKIDKSQCIFSNIGFVCQ